MVSSVVYAAMVTSLNTTVYSGDTLTSEWMNAVNTALTSPQIINVTHNFTESSTWIDLTCPSWYTAISAGTRKGVVENEDSMWGYIKDESTCFFFVWCWWPTRF